MPGHRRNRSHSRSDSRSRSHSHSHSPHSQSPICCDPVIRAVVGEFRELQSQTIAEIQQTRLRLDKLEKRVADNEGCARSQNLRVYGYDQAKMQESMLRDLILQLFTDGFKVPEAHALDIVQSLDMYHWTRDKYTGLEVHQILA